MRYRTMVGMIILALSFTTTSQAVTKYDEVVAFLKTNVIGKTVEGTKNAENEDFKQSWSYSNLVITATGLKFDEFTRIQQSVYALDEKGKRTGKPAVRDRSYSTTNKLGYRAAAEIFLGIKEITASTFNDPTGKGISIDVVRLEDGKLTLEWGDIGFTEWPKAPPATGANFLRSRQTEILWVDQGKLHRTYSQIASVVDPKSGQVVSTAPKWSIDQTEL